ncbi:putative DD34D transposase [Trichonephila clavipes]|nr:putative DD34D transposase [Trichonephila clavipes]
MDKKEFRVLIKHCFWSKKSNVETKAWLDKHYLDFSPGKSTVQKWFAKFKRGEMSTEDDARSGRPKRLLPTKTSKKSTK